MPFKYELKLKTLFKLQIIISQILIISFMLKLDSIQVNFSF